MLKYLCGFCGRKRGVIVQVEVRDRMNNSVSAINKAIDINGIFFVIVVFTVSQRDVKPHKYWLF